MESQFWMNGKQMYQSLSFIEYIYRAYRMCQREFQKSEKPNRKKYHSAATKLAKTV